MQDQQPEIFERYHPSITAPEISYEHLHRYLFASKFVENRKVLDLGCGEGYGSKILSQQALQIAGIDIDAATIQSAQSKYGNQKIDFKVASATQLDFPDQSFDTVVCFELIEHLSATDQNLCLNEIKRVLKKDGQLIISTPNLENSKGDNPYHLKEFSKNEFHNFIHKYFPHTQTFQQKIHSGSLIWPEQKSNPVYEEYKISKNQSGFRVTPNQDKSEHFTIIIASTQALAPTIGSICLDTSDALIESKTNWIQALRKVINEKDSYIKQLLAHFENKKSQIAALEKSHHKLHKDIATNETNYQTIIAEKDNYIDSLTSTLKAKENDLTNLSSELQQLNNKHQETELKLEDLWQNYLHLKANHEATLSSYSWRLTAPLRWSLNKLITFRNLLKASYQTLTKEGLRIFLTRSYNYLRYGAGYQETLNRKARHQWQQQQTKIINKAEFANAKVIFRPHGLGDLIMGLSAFQKLKETSNEPLILITYKPFVEFMEQLDIFDYVMPLPTDFNYHTHFDEIPKPKDSTIIDLMIEIAKDERGHHQLNNYNNKLPRAESFSQTLNLPTNHQEVKYPVHNEAQSKIKSLLAAEQISGPFVVLTFEATNPTRIWDPSQYLKLIKGINNLGYEVIVTGTKPNSIFNQDYCHNWIGKTKNINELAELVRIADYVISTDTGLYHLAGLLRTPFLTIFTGGVPPESRLKYYQNYEYIQWPDCCMACDMPCDKKINNIEPCKTGITSEDILNKFQKLTAKKTLPQPS